MIIMRLQFSNNMTKSRADFLVYLSLQILDFAYHFHMLMKERDAAFRHDEKCHARQVGARRPLILRDTEYFARLLSAPSILSMMAS